MRNIKNKRNREHTKDKKNGQNRKKTSSILNSLFFKAIFLSLLLICTSMAGAVQKVYKQITPNGEVVFTDTPPVEGTETAEEIKVDTQTTGINLKKEQNQVVGQQQEVVDLLKKQAENAAGNPQENRSYTVNIDNPKDGTIFPSDTLDINVDVTVTPPLLKGDLFQVSVDNVIALPLQSDASFRLPLLPAGNHIVTVQVVSTAGKILGSGFVQIVQIRKPTVPETQSAQPPINPSQNVGVPVNQPNQESQQTKTMWP